jgi:WD40 repeat protein
MQAILSIAWSPDARLLAINNAGELSILRTDTFEVTHAINVIPTLPNGGHTRFDLSAFSTSSDSLLLQNPNQGGQTSDIILYRFDLATGNVEPLLMKPLPGKVREQTSSGRFQRHNGDLLYSSNYIRYGEGGHKPLIIGNTDYGITLKPATCFVFNFGVGAHMQSVRSMDFPPPGQEAADVSKDIWDIRFSPATDRFVVARHVPYFIDGMPAARYGTPESFFESYDLATGAASPAFGKKPAPEEGMFCRDDFEIHPSKPWLVTSSSPTAGTILTIWDFVTGQALSRVKPTSDLVPRFKFSPDGRRIAFLSRRGRIVHLHAKLLISRGENRGRFEVQVNA